MCVCVFCIFFTLIHRELTIFEFHIFFVKLSVVLLLSSKKTKIRKNDINKKKKVFVYQTVREKKDSNWCIYTAKTTLYQLIWVSNTTPHIHLRMHLISYFIRHSKYFCVVGENNKRNLWSQIILNILLLFFNF